MEPSVTGRRRRPGRRIIASIALGWLLFGLVGVAGAALESSVTVLDENGVPLTSGEIEFYRDGALVTRLELGAGGKVEIDHSLFEAGVTYTISVFDDDLVEIYATDSWIYDPAAFDPEEDPAVGLDKYVVRPALNGKAGKALEMQPERTLNPDWEAATQQATEVATERKLFGPPRFLVGISYPVVMLGGGFGTDESVGGGVTEVSLGFGASLSFRSGYPDDPDPAKWIGFREFSLAYAMNGYTTGQILSPGEESDVTFHRVAASYGIGKMKGGSHWSAALALAYGGIYDGSTVLEYLGTTYNMFGVGLTGKYILRFIGDGGVDVGLLGQLDLMYYPAGDREHWTGLAPALSLGIVIY